MPKISVIVTVYNLENYIEKCISSILKQSFKDFELLIINDGSKDNSLEVVKQFTDKRITILDKENGGLSDARNFGLLKAKGDYILFIDGDDYIEQDMLEQLYFTAQKKSCDVVECAYYKEFEKRKIIKKKFNTNFDKIRIHPCNVWNKLYKKDIVNKINFLKNVWYEDIDFNIKISKYIETIGFVTAPLYHYIQRDGSIIHTTSKKILDIFLVCNDIINFAKNEYDKIYWFDMEYLLSKELLLNSFLRFVKYDKENNTKNSFMLYEYVQNEFPKWKFNKQLRKFSLVNLYLFSINKLTFRLYWKILKIIL